MTPTQREHSPCGSQTFGKLKMARRRIQLDERRASLPIEQCVYVMSSANCVKIGVAKDPVKRMRAIQTSMPWPVRLEAAWDVPNGTAFDVERYAHFLLARFRTRGEWFVCGMDKVREIEPALFSRAFGNAFKNGPRKLHSTADQFIFDIMRLGRFMTLEEQAQLKAMLRQYADSPSP